MRIKWKQFERTKGQYHLAKVNGKVIGLCIRTASKTSQEYWLGALVYMTRYDIRKSPGVHRGDFGPFDSLDAAKAAAEIMIGVNHV